MNNGNSILQKEEFCQWTAACRLASKGKPISDSTYDSEIDIVKTMANMQEHSQTLKLNRNKRAAVTSDEVNFVCLNFLQRPFTD